MKKQAKKMIGKTVLATKEEWEKLKDAAWKRHRATPNQFVMFAALKYVERQAKEEEGLK